MQSKGARPSGSTLAAGAPIWQAKGTSPSAGRHRASSISRVHSALLGAMLVVAQALRVGEDRLRSTRSTAERV